MHQKFSKIAYDKVGKYTDITEKASSTVQQALKVDVIDDKSLKKANFEVEDGLTFN